MKDLPNILPKDHCIMYADGITLFSSSKNFSEANTKLQNIASKTVDWIDRNRIIINSTKSNCIVFSSRYKTLNAKLDIYIKSVKINQVAQCKLLGIQMDQNLSWDLQCNEVCKHISKKFGLMKRLYSFLLQSHIDYYITSWGNCAIKYLGSIQKIQIELLVFLPKNMIMSYIPGVH